MNTNYTDDQVTDIKARMEKGNEALKELGLEVAVQIIPYLQDTRYKQSGHSVELIPENPDESKENA